jgi:hypothetical protein
MGKTVEATILTRRKEIMRQYHLHTRYNGIYYAELVNPQNGAKTNARPTGNTPAMKLSSRSPNGLKMGYPMGKIRAPSKKWRRWK